MDTKKRDEIEIHLHELDASLVFLAGNKDRPRSDFDRDRRLREQVERNLETASNSMVAICRLVVEIAGVVPPSDARQTVLRAGELGVVSAGLAERLTSLTDFHNLVVQSYLAMKWDEVYRRLQSLVDLRDFYTAVETWLLSYKDNRQ